MRTVLGVFDNVDEVLERPMMFEIVEMLAPFRRPRLLIALRADFKSGIPGTMFRAVRRIFKIAVDEGFEAVIRVGFPEPVGSGGGEILDPRVALLERELGFLAGGNITHHRLQRGPTFPFDDLGPVFQPDRAAVLTQAANFVTFGRRLAA